MTRLRVVFVAVALALLVPTALVVHKALDSVAAERELRHRTVADRVVDELERELSDFLRREEERPFGQYRYFYVPEGTPPDVVNLVRSPLSQPPRQPSIVCYFQIDPDGAVKTPLWPANEDLAATTGWQPQEATRALVSSIRATVAELWNEPAERLVEARDRTDRRDRPTADLDRIQERKEELGSAAIDDQTAHVPAAETEAKAGTPRGKASVLGQLNRAAAARRKRPTKVAPSQAFDIYNFERDEADNAVQSAIREQAESSTSEPLSTPPKVIEEVARALDADPSAIIDVRLEPMVGRLVTPAHLLLYRTVTIGETAYRQGLVVATDELIAEAARRVLADAALASRVRIETPGGVAVGASSYGSVSPLRTRHRFAEPFGAVAVDVFLDPLPEVGGSVYIYALALLVAVATAIGLIALYRMAAVALAYAERRSNFVSAVTHELKTPLTAMRMYSEMLRDGMVEDEPQRQRYYGILTAETERLTRLVDNVLELSRLEHKDRLLHLEAGDIGAVIADVATVLEPHAASSGFVLRRQVDADLPSALCDRDVLTQVLFNLVDNALKYAREAADKTIVLAARRRGEEIVIGVADRGPGVARRQLQKIFEPFYRGADESTRETQGTGIGLALVHGLVERMGGRVDARNREGGGLEISIYLPAEPPKA